MQELLAAATAAMNLPEETVLRSAKARAKARGVPVEEVLREWAGGDAAAAAPADAATPEEASDPGKAGPTDVPAPEAPAPAPAPPKGDEAGPAVETPGPAETAGEEPETEVSADGASGVREPESEPQSSGAIPRWLAAVFIVLPAFAVLYALFFPNGPSCGDGGALAVDPVTGVAVGCDGGEYGVEAANFFTLGRDAYAQCSSCHGENGGGGGNFPAFTGGELLAVFPDGACEEQVEWVRLGTAAWPDPTYGATNKPVGGSGAVMPGFGGALSEEELRAVVLYERVQFAGVDPEAATADCGLGGEGAPGMEDG